MTMQPQTPDMTVNAEQAFQMALMTCVQRGWQPQYVDPVSRRAVLYSPGGKCNDVAHLIAVFLTLGLWIPFWIWISAATPGPKTMTLTVDDAGQPHYTEPKPPGQAGVKRRAGQG